MIFNIPDVNFLKLNNKYYLYVDFYYWGNCKFGDFTFISILLYITKLELIEKYDFLTFDNFYFIYKTDIKQIYMMH